MNLPRLIGWSCICNFLEHGFNQTLIDQRKSLLIFLLSHLQCFPLVWGQRFFILWLHIIILHNLSRILGYEQCLHSDTPIFKIVFGKSRKLKWYHPISNSHSHHEPIGSDTTLLKIKQNTDRLVLTYSHKHAHTLLSV